MIKMFIGSKGSGKTKTLIELVNNASATSNGSVVCIEKGDKLIHAISYQARLIDTDEFKINNADALYGFIAGIYASNHDITDIFIDSALKICENDVDNFTSFATKISALVDSLDINVTITASMSEENITEDLKKFMISH